MARFAGLGARRVVVVAALAVLVAGIGIAGFATAQAAGPAGGVHSTGAGTNGSLNGTGGNNTTGTDGCPGMGSGGPGPGPAQLLVAAQHR